MILVTGANGQLGTELRHLLDERNEEYVAVDVAEIDITDADKVDEVFAEVKPTLVYHCAAYTACLLYTSIPFHDNLERFSTLAALTTGLRISGVMISPTSEVMIALKAAPITTALSLIHI